jgi:hypothetical protein
MHTEAASASATDDQIIRYDRLQILCVFKSVTYLKNSRNIGRYIQKCIQSNE